MYNALKNLIAAITSLIRYSKKMRKLKVERGSIQLPSDNVSKIENVNITRISNNHKLWELLTDENHILRKSHWISLRQNRT